MINNTITDTREIAYILASTTTHNLFSYIKQLLKLVKIVVVSYNIALLDVLMLFR